MCVFTLSLKPWLLSLMMMLLLSCRSCFKWEEREYTEKVRHISKAQIPCPHTIFSRLCIRIVYTFENIWNVGFYCVDSQNLLSMSVRGYLMAECFFSLRISILILFHSVKRGFLPVYIVFDKKDEWNRDIELNR